LRMRDIDSLHVTIGLQASRHHGNADDRGKNSYRKFHVE
jgi:hypothetical protein